MQLQVKVSPTPDKFAEGIAGSIKQYVRNSLRKIAEVLPGNIQDVFELEGQRGDHEKWVPTSLKGRAFRKAVMDGDMMAFENPTLVDDGELQDSITSGEIEESENEIILITGTDKAYAKKIEEGFSEVHPRSGENVTSPAREFLFFTQDDEEDIDVIFAEEEIPEESMEIPF